MGSGAIEVLCFSSLGHDHLTGRRVRELLQPLAPVVYPFDRRRRLRSTLGLFAAVRRGGARLIVMEGTGVAPGLALIAIDALLEVPYVVCSGDAVGPYLGIRSRALGLLGGAYERLLYRRSAGFVGWTPYLVGRALTFGAPRAMSAPGWAREDPLGESHKDLHEKPHGETRERERERERERAREREPAHAEADARERDRTRAAIRRRLEIAPQAIVVGLMGALNWNERIGYVYGAELVRAVRRLERRDVVACILGEGSGLERLRELAGEDLGRRVLLPGRVAPERVADYLAACDLASLSQSVDRVGAFRYTTKLSEYLAAGLPVLSAQTPLAYDLDGECFWRLPGEAPWSEDYLNALVTLLGALTPVEIARKRAAVSAREGERPFDKAAQQRRMTAFVEDLLRSRS